MVKEGYSLLEGVRTIYEKSKYGFNFVGIWRILHKKEVFIMINLMLKSIFENSNKIDAVAKYISKTHKK